MWGKAACQHQNLSPNPSQWTEPPVPPSACSVIFRHGTERFLTKLRCRGTADGARGPHTAGRGAAAQAGSEKTRGGSCRDRAAGGEPCRAGHCERSQPHRVPGEDTRKTPFAPYQSFLLGSPKQKPRADRRDWKGGHREANRRDQPLPCEKVRVRPGLWSWNLRMRVRPRP